MALVVTMATSGAAHAGAWTQGKGAFYLRSSVNRYQSTREFDANGNRHDFLAEGEFVDLNWANYVEYGLTDRLTAVASFAVKRLRDDNLARTIESNGIGDVDVALRARLASGRQGVAAVQVLAKIPSAYDVDVSLPLGNGERELDARLLYGRSLFPLLPGYLGLEAGYRWRAGEPVNEFRYLAELGTDLTAGFYVRSKLDGTRGERSDAIIDDNGNPTVRATSDLGALDVTAGRRFGPHLSLEAGVTSALYGRTTPSGRTLTLAVSYAGAFGHPDRTTNRINFSTNGTDEE